MRPYRGAVVSWALLCLLPWWRLRLLTGCVCPCFPWLWQGDRNHFPNSKNTALMTEGWDSRGTTTTSGDARPIPCEDDQDDPINHFLAAANTTSHNR